MGRNPLLIYAQERVDDKKDDKNILFHDRTKVLIPGSRMSFSKGVRI